MNDMSDTLVKVHYQGECLPEKPKIRIWHWINFYVYNFLRKPMVWKRQRELENLAEEIREALDLEVMHELFARLAICTECRNAYMALKPQIFLSQIKLILRQMKCDDHPEVFERFLGKYRFDFERSENIARWINGFS